MFNTNWQTSTEIFTLMDRPMVDELGLTMINAGYNWVGTGGGTGQGWFEWIPNEALAANNTKKYPLVISLHGNNDHPVYEAESNGWVSVAGKERIIVAAPADRSDAAVHAMINTLVTKYPIDESRIYVTGFSMGGNQTFSAASYNNPQYGRYARFAGMAPMSPPSANSFTATDVKIPFYYSIGSRDQYGASNNVFRFPAIIRSALTFNGMTEPQGVNNPFWAVVASDPQTIKTKYGPVINTATYYDNDDIPFVKLAYAENLDHAHFVPYGELAWDYLRQFSRDLATKEIIYTPNPASVDATFDLNVEVLEWGSATTAVIIDLGARKSVKAADVDKDIFSVSARTVMPRNNSVIYNGPRTVTNAYVSAVNKVGEPAASGRYIVLELKYGYNNTGAEVDGCAAINYSSQNYWLNQTYTVAVNGQLGPYTVNAAYNKTVTPIYDDFKLVNNPVAPYTGQTYRVYIPEGATGPLPLIVFNHGAGETYSSTGGGNEGAPLFANMGGVGWVKNAPENCIVLVPQRSLNGYSRPGVVAYINWLVNQGIADGYRLYVSGASAGGSETHSYLREYPDLWAAGIPICPASGGSLTSAQVSVFKDIPVWYIHAATDRTVAPSNSLTPYNYLVALGAKEVRRTEFPYVFGTEVPNPNYSNVNYPDGHWSWVMVLNNEYVEAQGWAIMDWLFTQSKSPNQVSLNVAPDSVVSGGITSIPVNMSVESLYKVSVISGELLIADSRFEVSADTAYPGASVVYNAANGKFSLFKLGGFTDAAEADLMTFTLTLKAGAKLTNGDTLSTVLSSVSFTYAFGADTGTSPNFIKKGRATTNLWVNSGAPGDMSGDGKVDGIDLAIALNLYGKLKTDANWYSSGAYFADINRDGVVDMEDIMAIAYLSVQ